MSSAVSASLLLEAGTPLLAQDSSGPAITPVSAFPGGTLCHCVHADGTIKEPRRRILDA